VTVESDLACQIFTMWQRMASGRERRNDVTWGAWEHIGRKLVDAVDPRAGETILELDGLSLNVSIRPADL
jgi:hypothetical protein